MNPIVQTDLERICKALSDKEKAKLQDAVILVTGCAGFLGFYFMHFFNRYKEEFGIKKIVGLDNFKTGRPIWLNKLAEAGNIELHEFDITTGNVLDIPEAGNADYILHMASIASPTFYRMYPLETVDANIWGLRRLLDLYCAKDLRGFLFFSSSEIYGNPTEGNIPTPETYRGNVDCQGPRACYDEAKRFGETICYLYREKYNMPISIVRPFNDYGPGMRLNDKRAPADFASSIYENRDVILYSDGSPTRTFCYVSDSIIGLFKALLRGEGTFNIGMDKPEITIRQLADIFAEAGSELLNYTGKVIYQTSPDSEYLTNNPMRRCPDISHAREILGYNPQISVEDGVRYFIEFIKNSRAEELVW